MDKQYEHHRLTWQDIEIEVRYCPVWTGEPYSVCHIEVEAIEPARMPLPITETGYRSHFDSRENIETHGGAVSFVLKLLEIAASEPQWKKREAAARQMSLFD